MKASPGLLQSALVGSFEGAGFSKPSSALLIATAGERFGGFLCFTWGLGGGLLHTPKCGWKWQHGVSLPKSLAAPKGGSGAKSRFVDSCATGLQERLLEGSSPISLQAVTSTKSFGINVCNNDLYYPSSLDRNVTNIHQGNLSPNSCSCSPSIY